MTIRGASHTEDAGDPADRYVDHVPDVAVPTTDEIFHSLIGTKLNNLTALQLMCLEGSLDVIHSLPKLQFLKLEEFHFGNKRILDNHQLHDLKTLIVNCVEEPSCSRSYMESFLKQFSNLRHLEIDNLRDLPLSFILMNFGKLKILKLKGSRLNDAAIRDALKAADAQILDTDHVGCLKGESNNYITTNMVPCIAINFCLFVSRFQRFESNVGQCEK